MTISELIRELNELVDGYGDARVIVEEVGDGFYGDLARVDTVMVGLAETTVTFLVERGAA